MYLLRCVTFADAPNCFRVASSRRDLIADENLVSVTINASFASTHCLPVVADECCMQDLGGISSYDEFIVYGDNCDYSTTLRHKFFCSKDVFVNFIG